MTVNDTITPRELMLSSKDWVPNHPHLPVLIYKGVITDGDVAGQFEQRFADNGWPPQWRDGIFDYHHYHTTAHEVLGIARGTARLVIGGPGGEEIDVEAGDALLLPAGTGHCRLSASLDFMVVGAYPPGMEFDLCKQAATPAILARIVALPFPERDPVNGGSPPLTQHWKLPPSSQ
ncbi:cupin domain-containing protein [Leclercia adecarboxylata]|uniref:cupin domain-containing protein n=1 Tax=Leclercia adecarboxylata TaxID=83655 RepID=UPI002029D869|nr:cupin domain-containing protein [Leclercia adecarboxylata]URN98535.1 cupin domain-containing protein [Leclercia adecarboxylata]